MISRFQKMFLVLGVIIFSFACVGCGTKGGDNVSEKNLNIQSQIYYMDVIDSTSSMTFDYMNPNYGFVSLQKTSSYIYAFDGKQIYNLISIFNTIPMNNIVSTENSKCEDLMRKTLDGIDIEVSYKYVNSKVDSNNATIRFYVLVDGTLAFIDNRKLTMFYSDQGVVDYEDFKSKIVRLKGSLK